MGANADGVADGEEPLEESVGGALVKIMSAVEALSQTEGIMKASPSVAFSMAR